MALLRLDFKAEQQRHLLRKTAVFSPTWRASSEQDFNWLSHLLCLESGFRTDFEVAASARGTAVHPQPV